MKFCHITSVHPRYDIRIFIKECQALATAHDVTLIVADSLGDEIKDEITILDVGKVAGGRFRRMRETTAAIYQKVLQVKPQIVHFHDPELMGIGRKLATNGIKVIYDVHEDVPKQVMNKQWIPKIIRPIISWLVEYQEKISSQKYAGIICATEIIAKRFGQYNPNTIAIHNYPILAELNSIAVPWESRQDSLCYLGSISETRGILPLVESLAKSKLPLELAGPYSNQHIEQQIKQTNGYQYVNYHGVLNRSEVAKLLAKVKIGMVTLLPTPSYLESLPIKLLEYMLAGIPVIASNFPLWEQYVKDNNCGLMVDPQNTQEIADACNYLINNPDLAKQMGENGRSAVLQSYIWEQERSKLIEFYNAL